MSLPGVKLSMAVIVIGLYLILILDEERDAVPLFALKATVVTAALALGGAAISLLPPSTIPSSLLMLMPTRLFLAANLLFAAVSLGLLGRYSSRWMRGASLVFATLLAFNSGPVMFYGFMAAGAVVALWKSVTALYVKTERAAAPFWLNVSVAALVIALVVKTVTGYAFGGAESRKALADNQANTVVQAAAAGKGLLLIGQQCCYLTQLQTRRPLLVEANALDQIPYAPESAPAANAALKAVYGVDLLDPPESVRSPGMPQGLTPVTKPLWEARSAEEWKELGEVFGFTQVLANAEWRLHLPEVARDPAQVLYAIPVVSSSGQ
jgi:hypothetical protein